MQVQITPPNYVTSPCQELWQVVDGGDAYVWSDNEQTIAMAQQLAQLLQPLAERLAGLPSLTAVLVLLEALRRNLDRRQAEQMLLRLYYRAERSFTLFNYPASSVATWLSMLHRLEQPDSIGPGRRGQLIDALLGTTSPKLLELDGAGAKDAIGWLSVGMQDRSLTFPPSTDCPIRCRLALDALACVASQLPTLESIELKLQTGLSRIPDLLEPAEEETEEQARPASFLEFLTSLRRDEELGGLVAVSLNAAATLALPRRPSDPDDLPSGGVSDISNRGHPERLLATELAAEPMLLLARIATGQALYVRREKPPESTRDRRLVLIESSVRTWGAMRLRCLAFALAVAASEERRRGTIPEFYTLSDSEMIAEDLQHRSGIAHHLGRLNASPYPIKALQEFSERRKAVDQAEPLLILAENTDRDPEFQRHLDDLARPFLVARIAQDGALQVVRRTRLGDEPVHYQRLPLPSQASRLGASPARDEPLFLRMSHPLPLRFSADLNAEWYCADLGPELWLIDSRGRLLCFDEHNRGALEIADHLPGTRVLAHRLHASELTLVLESTNSSAPRHFLAAYRKEAAATIHNLDVGNFQYAFDRDALIRLSESHVAFLCGHSGKVLAESPRKGTHVGEGFFCDQNNHLHVASYRLGMVAWHDLGKCTAPVGCATRDENDVPVALARDLAWSRRFSGTAQLVQKTGLSVQYTGTCQIKDRGAYGNHILIRISGVHSRSNLPQHWRQPQGIACLRVGLNAPVIESVYDHSVLGAARAINPAAADLAHPKDVRTRINAILTDGQTLALRRGTDVFLHVVYDAGQQCLRLQRGAALSDALTFEFQEDNATIRRRRWKMKRVSLPGGMAWLDKRGLLHLRSHRNKSELSLVLADSEMAGWFSPSNCTFGPAYFTGTHTHVEPKVVEWLREFCRQCFVSSYN